MASRTLTIVVVNYGSSELLRQNLVPTAHGASSARVVVVDNRSTVAELGRVTELCDTHSWQLIALDTNAGFGGGANVGVSQAFADGASDVLLLNPDARIDNSSIEQLAAATRDGRSVASPVVEDLAGRSWFAGLDLYLDDGEHRGHHRRAEFPGARRIEWLSGACLWIPRAIWRDVAGFAEGYFLYWEDVDFSYRVAAAGGQLKVVHEARAVHDEGGTHRSARQPSPAKSAVYYYFNIRNRMLFATLHLDESDVRRWWKTAVPNARRVLLRGGRRQFLRGPAPLIAAYRGLRDARRIVRSARKTIEP